MTKLEALVPALVLQNLLSEERTYLEEVFDRFNGYPNLEQMWSLINEPWVELDCDPLNIDKRITAYYQHPVWILNGLFVERHKLSLENRRRFAQWIVDQAPKRVADFGGGFGALARFIGGGLPNAQVEVVDPHPHPAAAALAADTRNVRFAPELTGEYDILIATDVFEHVPDPIGLTAETAQHLRVGGQYLIANCFSPVVLCHLPQLFYLEIAWDPAMRAMGLQPGERVSYGRFYRREGNFDVPAARRIANRGKRLWPMVRKLPRGRAKIGGVLVRNFCR